MENLSLNENIESENNNKVTEIEPHLKAKEVTKKTFKVDLKESLRKKAFKYFKNHLTVDEVYIEFTTKSEDYEECQDILKTAIKELHNEYEKELNKKVLARIKKEEAERKKYEKLERIEELKNKSSEYKIYIDNDQYYRFTGEAEGKRLTNFLISISKIIVTKDSDGAENVEYEFYIKGEKFGQDIILSEEETLDAKCFAKAIRKNVAEAFIDIREDDFAGLRAFIFNSEKDKYTKTIGYNHTGFIYEDEKLYFVEQNGAYNQEGTVTQEYISSCNKNEFVYGLNEVLDIKADEIMQILPLMLNINDKKSMVTIFGHALYCNYAGITKILFNKGNTDFKNIHMYVDGNPSSGKTSITNLVYKICGIKNIETYARKGTDTKVAIEHQLASTNSGCCVINELNKRSIQQTKYDMLVDMVKNAYDYLGNSKANINTNYQTTKQSPVNCPIVTIGQNRFTEDAIDFRGARVSFFKSNVDSGKFTASYQALEDKQDLLYKLGKSFKMYMLQNVNFDEYISEYKEIYKSMKTKYGNNDRYIRILTTLFQAYKNLERFLKTYSLTIKDVFNMELTDIEEYLYNSFLEYNLQGCSVDKGVELKYLELMDKAALYSHNKEESGIIHVPFKRDEHYKVYKGKDGVECLAISSDGLDNANALIREWIATQGMDANHLIDLNTFKTSIVNTHYLYKKNHSVKFGKSNKKAYLFFKDALIKDKVEVNYMLNLDEEDLEFIATATNKAITAEQEVVLLRKKIKDLEFENKMLKKQIESLRCESIPF